MRKRYHHLRVSDRERLYELLSAGKSKACIAEVLGRDRSVIYREVKRNRSRLGDLADRANRYYLSRRQKVSKLEDDMALQKRVIALLERQRSPRQIYWTLKQEDGVSPISAESIYQFI